MDDALLEETAAYVGVQRLVGAYADVINRRAFNELEALFEPECPVEIDTGRGDPVHLIGGRGVGDFVGAAVERFDFFEFAVLSMRVRFDGDRASGRVYMCEIRHESANGRRSDAFGLYQDRYVRSAGVWRFSHRRYRSLARTGAPDVDADMEVLPFPGALDDLT